MWSVKSLILRYTSFQGRGVWEGEESFFLKVFEYCTFHRTHICINSSSVTFLPPPFNNLSHNPFRIIKIWSTTRDSAFVERRHNSSILPSNHERIVSIINGHSLIRSIWPKLPGASPSSLLQPPPQPFNPPKKRGKKRRTSWNVAALYIHLQYLVQCFNAPSNF